MVAKFIYSWDVAPLLLQYLRSGRAPEYVKSSLVGVLVGLTSGAPEVVEAVSAVMTQKLKPQVRIEILNALGTQLVESPILLDRISDAIEDPDRTVQLAAIAAAGHIGPQAISRAASILARLAENSSDPEVNKAAREAPEGHH